MRSIPITTALAGATALALSFVPASAERSERPNQSEALNNVIRQLNAIPAFGDVLHVAERLPGRGLMKAAELDENPLLATGVVGVGAGVGGVAGFETSLGTDAAAARADIATFQADNVARAALEEPVTAAARQAAIANERLNMIRGPIEALSGEAVGEPALLTGMRMRAAAAEQALAAAEGELLAFEEGAAARQAAILARQASAGQRAMVGGLAGAAAAAALGYGLEGGADALPYVQAGYPQTTIMIAIPHGAGMRATPIRPQAVWPVYGRGLMRAAQLDENPLLSAGVIGGGAIVGGAFGARMAGLSDAELMAPIEEGATQLAADAAARKQLEAAAARAERVFANNQGAIRAGIGEVVDSAGSMQAFNQAVVDARVKAVAGQAARQGAANEALAAFEATAAMREGEAVASIMETQAAAARRAAMGGLGGAAATAAIGYGMAEGAAAGCKLGRTMLMVKTPAECGAIGGVLTAR